MEIAKGGDFSNLRAHFLLGRSAFDAEREAASGGAVDV